MAEIVWSPRAIRDVEAIYEYIAVDSRQAAIWTLSQILAKITHLGDFPKIGRVIPEIGRETAREVFYKSYRIMYEITDAQIEIITVYHGSRDFRGN